MFPVKPEDVQTIDMVGKVRIAKDRFRERGAASEETVPLADPLHPQDFERILISEVPAEDIRETAERILREGYADLEGLRIKPF